MGLLMVFIVAVLINSQTGLAVFNLFKPEPEYVVLIDAGHGGMDPGKVGINGALEKDINLAISLKLKTYLEASNITVILTRDGDYALYKDSDNNKKRADLQARCDMVNEYDVDLVISIHQNSFTQASASGPQTFYYSKSVEGKALAEIIQEQFLDILGDKQNRLAKANDSYYLLLNTSCPVVIVECGFLSNWEEAALLGDEDYQSQVALVIHNGIMKYLNN